ncbi:uncharacterized protein M437DRAFT_74208 [Aureobasidium melanogenum CBS 110374]|uniref:Wax synthase domain-containing protein n=1 Tax=Aureobasidium melanogenum (strain CBS 110374) TaxID=1043003 RepID=A0A074VYN2_AURM1|nr:uncharacterized protein M437DRAFT_74208 [Aureobasidium melanogenum CBS 110374]KEQ64389.1 hypothetical protein M437DRAFT_74208 [Aureobasidium melanogenum CBS 110374]
MVHTVQITMTSLISFLFDATPRPGLQPVPNTKPLTFEAAVLPPIIYFLALLFLPPPPPQSIDTIAIKLLRNALALLAGVLFFRLPLAYYVPQSIGLNYQLALVGLYGGCRVLDAFFISPYGFGHIPRRVRYKHISRTHTPMPVDVDNEPENPAKGAAQANAENSTVSGAVSNAASQARRGSLADSYFILEKKLSNLSEMKPVYELASSEEGWPHNFMDRASWALELETSMRGIGFTWTTADVRHSRKTWLPTATNRLHSIFFHVGPVLAVCFAIIRTTYVNYFEGVPQAEFGVHTENLFDSRLPLWLQLLLTAALGAFLMAAFSVAHSMAAILMSPLAPSPLAYFPPLYSTRIWDIKSVRGFWSYGWHRLFARLFLVYGVWPGEWLERKLTGKRSDEPADVGKVLGGFISSAFVHSFAVRSVLGGKWSRALGEAKFFAANGFAVVVEEAVRRKVMAWRKKRNLPLEMWYDAYIGRVWWIAFLLFSGRNFARGWVNAGLVREMAGK